MARESNILPFQPQSYQAALQLVQASGFEFRIAGTLDGFVDFAVTESDGARRTYNLTCDDLRLMIAAFHAAITDVQDNCLFDRDPLLMPDGVV